MVKMAKVKSRKKGKGDKSWKAFLFFLFFVKRDLKKRDYDSEISRKYLQGKLRKL